MIHLFEMLGVGVKGWILFIFNYITVNTLVASHPFFFFNFVYIYSLHLLLPSRNFYSESLCLRPFHYLLYFP